MYNEIMDKYSWYGELVKPSIAPAAWLYGPVWTLLYAIIAITYGFVFYKVATRKLPTMVAVPFALNLFFNLIFTPLQFGLKNNILASIDILFILGTLIWALVAIHPHIRWVALANIPQFLWVCFATTLQLSITYLNF